MTLFVDTNIFIRFFLNDHKTQSPAAHRLFDEARKGKVKLVTDSLVIAEMVFTLSSVYKLTKQEITQKVQGTILFEGLEILGRKILVQALTFYKKKTVDFIDAYIAAISLENNFSVCSFDRDFEKIKEIKRIKPVL